VRLACLVFFPFLDTCFSTTAETTLGYRDEVPPIDQREIDALHKRIEEVQKRLHKGDKSQDAVLTPDRRVERSGRDYQDDVAPLDPDELEDFQRSVEALQQRLAVLEQKRKTLGERAKPAPPAAPSPGTGTSPSLSNASPNSSASWSVKKTRDWPTSSEDGPNGTGFFCSPPAATFFFASPEYFRLIFEVFRGGQDGNNPGVQPSTFLLQRARFSVHGRLY
jgi:hypothetical protein